MCESDNSEDYTVKAISQEYAELLEETRDEKVYE